MKKLPSIRDLYIDQQNAGLQAIVDYDRPHCRSIGNHARSSLINRSTVHSGRRKFSTIYTSLNQYHVVMEAASRYTQSPLGPELHLRPSSEWKFSPSECVYPDYPVHFASRCES